MKGYTVFNVEQIDGLPEQFYAKAEPRGETVQRIARAEAFFAATGANVRHGGNRAYYSVATDHVQMPPFEASATPKAITRRSRMRRRIGPATRRALTAISGASASAMKATPWRSLSPSLARPSCPPTST